MQLFLLRHAEATDSGLRYWGQTDIPLTPKGRAQAERLRERLAKERLEAVYASDLERARHTAEAIASAHSLEIILCPELREMNFGQMEGKTLEEMGSYVWQRTDLPFPGGESLEAIAERVGRFPHRLSGHQGDVAVVAHGGSLRLLLCHFLGLSPREWWRFHFSLASVSVLELHSGGASLRLLNDACHLAQGQEPERPA